MADKSIRIRMVMEGGKVVEAEMVSIGTKGEAAMQKLSRASGAAGGGIGQIGSTVQNAGYQLTDFIVQVDGGTDIMRAMGQQLPQLLAGFGVFGVVAGVAAAALGPLLRMMFDGQDPVQALTEDLKALEGAMSGLRSANGAAGADLDTMLAKYGEMIGPAREMLKLEEQAAQARAQSAFVDSAQSTANVFGGGLSNFSSQDVEKNFAKLRELRAEAAAIEKEFENANEWFLPPDALNDLNMRAALNIQAMRDLGDYASAMETLDDLFQVGEEAAIDLAIAASKLGDADTTDEMTAAQAELAKYIFAATNGLKGASEETRDLYDGLINGTLAGYELQKITTSLGLGGAADDAARLAGNLADAAKANASLAARSIAQQPGNLALQKYGSRGVESSRPIEDAVGNIIRFTPATRGGGGSGGGGGGGGGVDRVAQEVERLNAAVVAGSVPAAKFTAEMAKLDELRLKGLSDGAYAEGVRKLNAELAASSPFGKMADSAIDALLKGEDALAALENGFKTALANIAKEILNAQLGKVLAGSIGGGAGAGGGLGSLIGAGGAAAGGGGAAAGGILGALGGPIGIALGIFGIFGAAAARRREAEQRAAQARAQVNDQSDQLEIRLLELQGRSVQALARAREIETARTEASLRPLLARKFALEDEVRILDQRNGLEDQLLQLQGDQAALDARWLKTIDPANLALAQQIIALRTAKEATDDMNAALGKLSEEQFASALDFARARGAMASGLRVVAGTDVAPAAASAGAANTAVSGNLADATLASISTNIALLLRQLQRWDDDDRLRVVSA